MEVRTRTTLHVDLTSDEVAALAQTSDLTYGALKPQTYGIQMICSSPVHSIIVKRILQELTEAALGAK